MTCLLSDMQRDLMHISRDALAGVLGVTGERGTRIEGIRCIDLRRHDERALYGSIPGADPMHLACTPNCLLHAPVLGSRMPTCAAWWN